jgi:hypothetical protein
MGTEAREKDAVRNKVARRMMPRHDHRTLPFVALLPDVGSKGIPRGYRRGTTGHNSSRDPFLLDILFM